MSEPSRAPAALVREGIAGMLNTGFSAQNLADLERAIVEKTDAGIGDVDTLDILLNLALGTDELGCNAERIAFNLFSGKSPGSDDIADSIAERCLALYQLARPREPLSPLLDKLRQPSLLCYMAGAAGQALATEKEEISVLFPADVAQASYEQIANNKDMWCHARMVSTDEIAATLNAMKTDGHLRQEQFDRDFSINFPIPLLTPGGGENLLKSQLLDQKNAFTDKHPDHPFHKTNIFPINHQHHWTLFAAYPVCKKNSPDKCAAVVFSSAGSLSQETRNAFSDAAQVLGIDEVEYVDRYLQEYTHNGCGLLVVEAIRQIVDSVEGKPDGLLKRMRRIIDPAEGRLTRLLREFAERFEAQSPQAQKQFNICKRREMLGDYIVARQAATAGTGLTVG